MMKKVTVYFSTEDYLLIKMKAKAEHKSISAWIRGIAMKAFEQYEKKHRLASNF